MKISIFLLCMGIFSASATVYSQDAKVSIQVENQSVNEVFSAIRAQTSYSFWFDIKDVDVEQLVSLNATHETVKSVLSQALKNQDVDFAMYGNHIVIAKKSAFDNHIVQQQRITITGSVTDKGEPIPGVNVVIKGTTNGVISDSNGKYSITVPDKEAVLVFSFVGYKTEEVVVGDQTVINFSLNENTVDIREVVVVAYGTQNKRQVTGAMETVKFTGLDDIPVAQLSQKLQGQMTGVQIDQGTGKPGQGMNIRIRGSASISSASTPLYVVDGFPIVGDINNINPNEIESITVLKDAAATSLYGSRAAFGVVLITTKRAKAGETRINANAYMGIQQVPKRGRPDMMNGAEWAQFRKEHYEDMGLAVPDAFKNPSQYGKGYDWYDAMLRSAMISDYSVSVNTNKDNLTSSIMLGYFKQEGTMINSAYNRFTARANNEYQFSDKFKIALNVAPSYSYDNAPPSDGTFFSGGGLLDNARLTAPILSWDNADGSMPVAVTTPGITSFSTPNWIRSAQDIVNKSEWRRLLSNAYLEYEPITNLKFKTGVSIDLSNSNTHYFEPSTAGRGFNSTPGPINANLLEKTFRYYSWLSETTVSYAKQFNDHEFDVLGGYITQKYNSNYSEISGYNYPDDRIETIDMALMKNNPKMDVQEWSMISYLVRMNYNYKGRYIIGASLRRDGSSRFGNNNKWGNFPSASLGWIVSEEAFMEQFKALSFLKIRGSYGIVGNNNIGNYTQYNTVSGSNTVFGNTSYSGTAVTNLGNDDLGWEKTRQLDLGIDIGFLSNRINFTYDYYHKLTTDLLYQLPIPQESGFSKFTGNVGEIKFWGHEFTINSKNLIGNFKWNTNFNIAFSDNQVLKLSSMSDQLVVYAERVSTITKVGGRIGQFYGPIQEGVYVNQQDFDNSPKLVDSQVGTIKFRDVNKDGKITLVDVDGDKTEMGNPFPKFIFGFTNNFSYKNFDLSIIMSGSYGNKILADEEGITNLDGVFNVLKDINDRWRSPESPGAGKYGKSTGATEQDRGIHSRCVYDGSHLSIKNVTLGYNIPCDGIMKISNLRIYGSIQQLFVFTKYKYGNPEAGVDINGNPPSPLMQGIDFSTYPVPRTFTMGLSITL